MSIWKLPGLTTAQRTGLVLDEREIVFDTDLNAAFIGDGVTSGGIQLSTGGINPYIHTQGSSSTTWTINHNLGYRPSVEVIDSGNQEIDADISHPTVNQTIVQVSPPTSGIARLI